MNGFAKNDPLAYSIASEIRKYYCGLGLMILHLGTSVMRRLKDYIELVMSQHETRSLWDLI